MKHRIKGRKLNRTASHRLATFRALATALLREKKIKTTVAKAKEIRLFVEPMITRAKNDSVAARRIIAKHINDKEIVKELFNEIAPKIGDRPGGYTRVVKLGRRLGDAAEMAIIELVDYNDTSTKKKPKKAITEDAKIVEESVADKVVEEEIEEAVVVNEEIVETSDEDTVETPAKSVQKNEEESPEVKAEESSEVPKKENNSTEVEKKEEK